LRRATGPYLFHEAPAIEGGIGAFVAARILGEPVSLHPGVLGPVYLCVGNSALAAAGIEEEVAKYAPSGGQLELLEERQQAIDHELPLDLANPSKGLRTEQIERSPDQLEVEAEGEHAAGQGSGPG
jgi:hypothetical protein